MSATTPSRAASPDVFLPQELKDHIVSHLSEDRSALLACCLAHRTLRATAQPHLFSSIYISRAIVAQRLRWALDAFPYLCSYVHKLVIAEEDYDDSHGVDTASVAWIGRAHADLASILSALPHLPALSLRIMDTYFYRRLKTMRHAFRRISPAAMELVGLQEVPPELFAGVRALRLVCVSIDISAPRCACTPVVLELCSMLKDDIAALLLDVRNLKRLRLSDVPWQMGELVDRCAATLQALEVDQDVPLPRLSLPALRVLATRELGTVREWLQAAPGVRHLVVYVPMQIQLAIYQTTGHLFTYLRHLQHSGMKLLDAETIAEGRALEVVTIVAISGEESKRQWYDVVGSYRYGEKDVEIRHMRVPMPNSLDNAALPSLIEPDILDGNWASV